MINCSKCGCFISYDWSNLSEVCNDCNAKEHGYTSFEEWMEEGYREMAKENLEFLKMVYD